MKNIKAYKKDIFEFHKKVVSTIRFSKKDPKYKVKINKLNDSVEKQYDIFTDHFKKNKLEDLNNQTYSKVEKETLLKLYHPKRKVIQELKIYLTTDEKNRIINTCQNCTIGEVGSLDHFIPKTEFPEYVVNPKNLFPCCNKCNNFKSTAWRKDNKRIFLNLYLDELPKEQYLFVDINVNHDDIDLTYILKNTHNIDLELFDLIENHYEKLHLFKRFKENSDAIISEIIYNINSHLKFKFSISQIKEVIKEDCDKKKKVFGHNYWKLILELSLINNDDFMNRFKKVHNSVLKT